MTECLNWPSGGLDHWRNVAVEREQLLRFALPVPPLDSSSEATSAKLLHVTRLKGNNGSNCLRDGSRTRGIAHGAKAGTRVWRR